MDQALDRSPHTLAQLARRAGISEGRARALSTATPSGLPRPDGADADGRPLWSATTIDAWCARTGRKVSTESMWVFRAPAASSPVPELQRGIVTLKRSSGRPQNFYVIVWDTAHGHVIYLQPLDDTGGEHRDWLAKAAGQLISPRWWAEAVVIMPVEESLDSYRYQGKDADTKFWRTPVASVYRLYDRSQKDQQSAQDSRGTSDPGGVFGGLRRWISRTDTGPLNLLSPSGPTMAAASWQGHMDLAEIAAVIGRPMPLWVENTTTTQNARQTLSYDRTFIGPDTVTEWPAAQDRLTQALAAGMPEQYPAAFAALAAASAEGLRKIQTAHERLKDTGPGWYLVCRPARPAPPLDLEQIITTARPATDPDQITEELILLRSVEGDLDIDDPRGDAYAEALPLLSWQLHQHAKETGRKRDTSDYLPFADDGLQRYSSPWEGPVVEAWSKTLTPVPAAERAATLRLRRIQHLIRGHDTADVQQIYRDSEDRYVLIVHLASGDDYHYSEWPADLQVIEHWNDQTVIAGDETGSTTTLLALTPTSDGRMRIDPVPLLPRTSSETFAFGYGGGTPAGTYQALLRCALGDGTDLPYSVILHDKPDGTPASQLWEAISTTQGSLRLSWPQLKLWARADKNRATT